MKSWLTRWLQPLVLGGATVALIAHLVQVALIAWPAIERGVHARDFASYYYAARAAEEGLDPWDKRALSRMARDDGTRRGVHPFLYPPPFLLLVRPFTELGLHDAYVQWSVLSTLCGIGAVLVLSIWWRGLHPVAPLVLFTLLACLTAAPNNLIMGQANFEVLVLAALALWLDDRDRQLPAGILLGCACMAKMSPALFVLWWALHRRWVGVGAAIGTAVVLSLLTLPLVDAGQQLHFYTDVLPGFASGRYNGLTIPIGLFGNHSLPDVFHQLFPGTTDGLSSTSRWLGRLSALGMLGVSAWAFHGRRDPWQRAAQASSIAVLLLLLPVYTYEHHLIWAVPAAGIALLGLLSRRLHWALALPVVLAVVALCWDLQHLKRHASDPSYAWVLREAKFGALVVLWATSVWMGRQSSR